MHRPFASWITFAFVCPCVAVAGLPAAHADFPDRPIRLVVPFTPGGSTDILARMIGLSAAPHIKAGKLRAIAVTTSKRNAAWPDVPTVSESGLKGYESLAWYGIVGPAKLPQPVLTKLSTETIKATHSSDMQAALVKQGAEPVGSTPREFAAFIRSEMTKYARVIKEAGVKAE